MDENKVHKPSPVTLPNQPCSAGQGANEIDGLPTAHKETTQYESGSANIDTPSPIQFPNQPCITQQGPNESDGVPPADTDTTQYEPGSANIDPMQFQQG